MATKQNDDNTRPPRDVRRRPYSKPALTRYGSLARLTQTGRGTMSEGAVTNRMNCL